ncbi:MAG: XRE family transcriptional regulator [Actinomycetota bacterium]|nr:XRE family transcriptional regulator [Actinomycetota bacterium]
MLFVFDPSRRAVLLVGGNRAGQWQSWYRRAIPEAERLYAQHVETMKNEEEQTMKHFEELEADVMADASRRERVERERAKVVAEQVRDALGELRRVRQLTQVELSRTMQRPQSTISRIEREGDMLLSTLAAYVEALGGHLEINAVVDGKRIPLTATDAPATKRSA